MFGDGAAAFLSIKLGEKNYEEGKKGISSAIFSLGILSVIFGILFQCFLPNLLNMFGCTENIMPYALDYGRIIIIGLPFMMMATCLNSIIRSDGDPKYSMISMLTGAIINIILDPIFLFLFNLGVPGAPFATIIGQFLLCIISILYLVKLKNFISEEHTTESQ